MDPISMAIVTTLAAGVSSRTAESAERATAKAYEAFKAALRRRFGADSDLIDAVNKLEKKPESRARQELLKEEVAEAKADQDSELLLMAQTLLEKVEAKTGRNLPSHSPSLFLPPPLQRPARADHFIGREMELAYLLSNLQPGRVVALCGPAGIGKSALAAEAVWKLAPGDDPPAILPHGIIYHNFYNQSRADIALEQIARTFGEKPVPTPYDAARRALAGRQALLVLDGVEQADDLPGVLAMRGGCGVLITSRQDQSAIAEQQNIGPLPREQAVSLLQACGGAQAADKTIAQSICELVDGSPLAVRLAGRYLATRAETPAEYLAWLEETTLSVLDPGQRYQESILLLLERSLMQVSESARLALAIVGLLAPGPFERRVIAEGLTTRSNQGLLASIRSIFSQKSEDRKIPNIRLAMHELVDHGLLRRVKREYEVSHELIHTYAQRHLAAPAKTIRRLATYYVAQAWEQNMQGTNGRAKLDAARPHIMRVLAECLEWKDWEAAHSLAVAIEDYLDLQGYWSERVIANEVGLIAAWQMGGSSEEAWMGNLGDTFRTMGHAKWAIEHFEKALATARRTGNWHSVGNSLGNLGLAYRDLGQMEKARQYLKESQAIFADINSPRTDLVRSWLIELEEWEQ